MACLVAFFGNGLWRMYNAVLRAQGQEPITEEAALLVEAEVKNIATKLDNEGMEHAIFNDMENLIRDNRLLQGEAKAWHDSAQVLTGVLGDARKELHELTSVNSTLRASLLKALKTDSGYNYSDNWADIQFILPTDSTGPHFNLAYNVEFNFARIREKGNFFRDGKSYTDIWLTDKRATIDGVRRVKIEYPTFRKSVTVSPFTSATLHSRDIISTYGAEILYRNGNIGLSYRYQKPLNTNIYSEKASTFHTLTLSTPLVFREW